MADKLGDYFVEFGQKGQDALKAAMDDLNKAIDSLGEATSEVGKAIETRFKDAKTAVDDVSKSTNTLAVNTKAYTTATLAGVKQVADGMAGVNSGVTAAGRAAATAFAAVSLQVGGFVAAGLAASAMGAVLTYQIQRLSLAIAGLFGPELQRIIDLVTYATERLWRLSDASRDVVARFVLGGVSGLAFAMMLPRLASGASLVFTAIGSVVKTMATFGTLIGGFLPLAGMLAVALGGIAAGGIVKNGGFGELFKQLAPVIDAVARAIDKLQSLISGAGDVAAPVFQSLVTLATAVIDTFVKLVDAAMPIAEVVADVLPTAINILAGVVTLLGNAIDTTVGKFALMAVAAYRIIPAMIDVGKSIWAATTATLAFIKAQIVKLSLMGPAGWAILAGAGIVAGVGLLAASRSMGGDRQGARQNTQPRDGSNRSPLAPRPAGPESIEATWWRIAQASILATAGGRTHEQTVEESLSEIAGNTGATREALRRLQPAVS